MYVRMYVCVYVCAYVCVYVYMYVCMYVCVCVNISMYNCFFEVSRIHGYYFPINDCLRTVDHVNVKLTVKTLLASQNPAVRIARSSSCCSCMQLVNEGRCRETKQCQRLNRWPLNQDGSLPCSETGAKAEGRFHWTAVLCRTCPIHHQPHGPCRCRLIPKARQLLRNCDQTAIDIQVLLDQNCIQSGNDAKRLHQLKLDSECALLL
jgi:hypothetical protein